MVAEDHHHYSFCARVRTRARECLYVIMKYKSKQKNEPGCYDKNACAAVAG